MICYFPKSQFQQTFANSITKLRGWNYSSRPLVRSIFSCQYQLTMVTTSIITTILNYSVTKNIVPMNTRKQRRKAVLLDLQLYQYTITNSVVSNIFLSFAVSVTIVPTNIRKQHHKVVWLELQLWSCYWKHRFLLVLANNDCTFGHYQHSSMICCFPKSQLQRTFTNSIAKL